MNRKLPYYMAYPLPLAYDDEKRERADYEYMKSLYPDMAKKLLPYVEEECDRMEHQHSMLYDEYPDKLQLRLMCRRIYEAARKNEKMFYGNEFEEIFPKQCRAEEASRGETERRQPGGEEPESEWEPVFSETKGQNLEGKRGKRHSGKNSENSRWIQDLIEVMLYHELYKRRCDHRRCSHRIY